jgi:hypothetical protein
MVYIAATDDGFYLIDTFGNIARGVWFSHYDDACEYCERQGLNIANMECEDA